MKKILLIEDDLSLSKMYSLKLAKSGFEALTALSGNEALLVLKEQRPDLILLDIMLPDISGLEVLKEIKSENSLKNIPVIVLTALPEVIALRKALDLGADSYLIKSETTPEVLIKYIQLELERHNGRK